MENEKRDHPLALAVRWMRESGDGRQATLAARSGLSESTIRRYEKGKTTPRQADLEAVAAGAELPVPLAELLSWCQKMKQGGEAASTPGTGTGLSIFIEKIVQAAAPEEFEPGPPGAPESEAAAALSQSLLSSSKEERRMLLETTLEYRSWALVELVCRESRRMAAHDPQEALELAELALAIAELVAGEQELSWRLQGLALAHVANAQRVLNQPNEARETFTQAKKLWQDGAAADPGLLEEAQLQSLEVSLLTVERRYEEAMELADLARVKARGEVAGDLLLKKANALELAGRYQAALAVLRTLEPQLADSREPRKVWLHRFSLMSNLCHVGRVEEAAHFLPEARELTKALGKAMDRAHFSGLEGRVAAGLGRWEEAARFFEKALGAFTAKGMPYDMALVTLELAAVYLEMGRAQEVKQLAAGLVPVFEQQGIPEEAGKALALFCKGVEQELATAELARQIVAFLYRAQGDSELRFERSR